MSSTDYRYRARTAQETAARMQRLLGVTGYDLEHNRSGQLSAWQRRQLLQRYVWGPVLAAIGVAAAEMILGVFYHWYIESSLLVVVSVPFILPNRVLLDIVSGRASAIKGKGDIEMRGVNDHVSRDERMAEWLREEGEEAPLGGQVRAFEAWDDSQPIYHLRVAGEKFAITKRMTYLIEDGMRYTAYYTPYGKKLVGLEPALTEAAPSH